MRWYTKEEIQSRYLFAAAMPDAFWEINGFTRGMHYNAEQKLPNILRSGSFASWGYFGQEPEQVPKLDHALICKNVKEHTCALIYQPYFDGPEIREEVEAWDYERGLEAEVYSNKDPWYTHTCLVVVHLPNKEIKVPDRERV